MLEIGNRNGREMECEGRRYGEEIKLRFLAATSLAQRILLQRERERDHNLFIVSCDPEAAADACHSSWALDFDPVAILGPSRECSRFVKYPLISA